jgi:hypothetical protein
MSKLGIMGGTAIAVSLAVVAWNYRPAHASDPLLGKAQSEFAIRARDALIQRRMAQVSATSEVAMAPVVPATSSTMPVIPDTLAVASEPSSVQERTYVVASLEPVAPPANSFSRSPDPAVASQPPAADTVKAQPAEVRAPEVLAPAAQPEVAATEEKPAAEIQPEASVEPRVEAQIEAKTAPVQQAPVTEAEVTPTVTPVPEAPAVEAQAIPVETPAPAPAPKALTVETQEAPAVTPMVTPVQKPIRARKPEVAVAQTQLERETAWADESVKATKPAAIVATAAPVQPTAPVVHTYASTQTYAPAMAPAVAAPQAPVKVARRPVQEPCPARVTANDHGYRHDAPREGYQARISKNYGIPKDVVRSGMSALRARDPQLAAMIARYM